MRNFDRDFLIDPGIFGEVNRAESATAEWREDLVLSNDLAAEKHWREYTACKESGSLEIAPDVSQNGNHRGCCRIGTQHAGAEGEERHAGIRRVCYFLWI